MDKKVIKELKEIRIKLTRIYNEHSNEVSELDNISGDSRLQQDITLLEKNLNKIEFTTREKDIMQEAFMVGRVYANTGEKENPVEIQNKLKERCMKSVTSLTDKVTD